LIHSGRLALSARGLKLTEFVSKTAEGALEDLYRPALGTDFLVLTLEFTSLGKLCG
jgi:hypothetical protein